MISDSRLRIIGKKLIAAFAVGALTLLFFLGVNLALAQEADDHADDPALPAVSQTITLEDVAETLHWNKSSLSTNGLKFMVRGKEALAWVMGIDDAGFDNPAIKSSYQTVLTVVNSLFILGLLGIAVLWMFSLIIPRHQLKRVIFVYALAVIFVNFAMPINRLFIDGTSLLQKTFLTQNGNPIGIVDIVNTPTYEESVSYENTEEMMTKTTEKTISLKWPTDNETARIPIGTIVPDEMPTGINGTIGEEPVFLLAEPPTSQRMEINANRDLYTTIQSEEAFDPNQEQAVFSFTLMLLTGLAYLLIALIFLLRIVILWALLIVSPLLFLLAVFNTTRGYFINWLNLYGRWLLIGPLVALGIAITVNIWQTVGLPVTSSYGLNAAAHEFGSVSSVRFRLPGSTVPNDLSTTSQMMEYILFLMMLYLPIFFGFALTRQKTWQAAVSVITESRSRQKQSEKTEEKTTVQKESEILKEKGLIGGIKDFFGARMNKLTETALPARLKEISSADGHPVLGPASLLPEQLAVTDLADMLKFLGANGESRHSRDQVINKLAHVNQIRDPEERRHAQAVREEIENRAQQGNAEAILLRQEMRIKKSEGEANIFVTAPENTPQVNVTTPMETAFVQGGAETDRASRHEEKDSAKTEQPIQPLKSRESGLEEEGEIQEDANKADDESNPPLTHD